MRPPQSATSRRRCRRRRDNYSNADIVPTTTPLLVPRPSSSSSAITTTPRHGSRHLYPRPLRPPNDTKKKSSILMIGRQRQQHQHQLQQQTTMTMTTLRSVLSFRHKLPPPRAAVLAVSSIPALLLLLLLLAHDSITMAAGSNDNNDIPQQHDQNHDYITNDSVVLITGALGFIGSELAMTLHRTYHPKHIICVDSMTTMSASMSAMKTDAEAEDETRLALFEYKRQRLFRVMQTLGSTGVYYRVDFRTAIPEYHDDAAVPTLQYIFQHYSPDITHVVHLADAYHGGGDADNEQQPVAVPRISGQTKAGMMETLLEQIVRVQQQQQQQQQGHDRTTDAYGVVPHFTYASSSEVYNDRNHNDNNANKNNGPPFAENETAITAPSSLKGASKLIDEVLARTYHQTHGIYSAGLRLFAVYGPWATPGNTLFDVAERAVAAAVATMATSSADGQQQQQSRPLLSEHEALLADNVRDYIYIDDAVDAIMSAMQFRTPASRVAMEDQIDDEITAGAATTKQTSPPIIFNVGTGVGTTLRTIADSMSQMLDLGPPVDTAAAAADTAAAAAGGKNRPSTTPPTTVSYASTTRSRQLLGFEPQFTLQQGLEQTLAWHHDRAYPYGRQQQQQQPLLHTTTSSHHIASKGIAACSRYDAECLRGTPVFPCASECSSSLSSSSSSSKQCIPTIYDGDVMEYTQSLTGQCGTVMYTVALDDDDLATIPSADHQVSTTPSQHSYVVDGENCNIAFVSDTSPLVRRLRMMGQTTTTTTGRPAPLMHGFWTLVPIVIASSSSSSTTTGSSSNNIIPGRHTIERLLPKLSPGLFFAGSPAGKGPKHAIYVDPDVIFHGIPTLLDEFAKQPAPAGRDDDTVQGATALLIGKRSSSSSRQRQQQSPRSSTSTTTTTTRQESIQQQAYQMTRIAMIEELSAGNGFDDDGGGAGDQAVIDSSFLVHALNNNDDAARLFRCDVFAEVLQWGVSTDAAAFQFVLGLRDHWSRVMVQRTTHGKQPWWVGKDVRAVSSKTKANQANTAAHRRLLETSSDNDDDAAEVNIAAESEKSWTQHNGFGESGDNNNKESARRQEDDRAVEEEHAEEPDAAASSAVDDDDENTEEAQQQQQQHTPPRQGEEKANGRQQPSTSDDHGTWMGILSSGSNTQYFARIVSAEMVGAVHLDDHDVTTATSTS